MRLLSLLVLASALTLSADSWGKPPAAGGRPAVPVRVTNFPEVQEVMGSVEVSNLPGPTGGACAPFQLVRFTRATFTGGEGVINFTRWCQAEFPGSRMCSSVEVMETTDVPFATGRCPQAGCERSSRLVPAWSSTRRASGRRASRRASSS